MLFKSADLVGYIPFTHVGNHHVHIDFTTPVTAILGSNGCGKSSLLRILDVASPPIRTDFLKDGSIEMVVEHDGHIFTLSSDFKNASAPHSFKKDGIELNPSGTSDVQRDLASEHLGVTPMINELMAGNIHICSMQKALRKQLFSAMYPSDLSFLLEYHKKVCSQVRALGNQIKLLQGREGSLMASLIEESERTRLTQWCETAQAIITRIDKINLLLETEVAQLKNHEALKKPYNADKLATVEEDLNNNLQLYRRMLMDHSFGKKFGETITKESLHDQFIQAKNEVEHICDTKKMIESNLITIRDELDKFIKIKTTPTSDKKDAMTNELELLKKELEDVTKNPQYPEYPMIQKDKMPGIKDLVIELEKTIAVIHPYSGKLIGQEEITKLRSENDTIRFSLGQYMAEKSGIEGQLSQCRSRKDMLTQNSYPKDCDRVCGLRATLEASVRDIDLRIAELEARLKKIHEDVIHQSKHLEDNQKVLQEISPVLPTLKKLYDKLSENYLIDLALDGETFLDCLNEHCFEITNRITRGYEAAQLYYRGRDLTDRITAITDTLSMMEANEAAQLSAEMIDDIIVEKQTKFESTMLDLDRIDKEYERVARSMCHYAGMENILKDIERIIQNANDGFNALLIQKRIEFDEQIISEHNNVRNVLSSKLRETEHTLNDQKRILDILSTEIRPTLTDLRQQKNDWELVESGLSPTKGLPCIYLIRFMNRLIARTNAFIEQVWYCDMELAYIEEKDSLDFSMQAIFNKSTTVKDISLCSKGQQAVIDTAFMLALAVERGFVNWMPVKLDETDAALTPEHRAKLVQLLSDLIENGTIRQLMMVSHFAAQTGIPNCENVVLSGDNIVLPEEYNNSCIVE